MKLQNIYIKGLSKGKKIYIKAQRDRAKTGIKTGLKPVFSQIFQSSQKGQVAKKNFGCQMVSKVAKFAINRKIWQH